MTSLVLGERLATMDTFRPLDLDFVPNPGAPHATLLQSEMEAFLVFNAIRRGISGERQDDAIAIFRFDLCCATRFGYPNDEPRGSIPRYKSIPADIVEVSPSAWSAEVQAQNRIGFPNRVYEAGRHFLFQFKDSTFECLCEGFEVELTREHRTAIIERIGERLK